ncbi:MAG: hypothetical protein ACE5E6_06550 [Phycisphaerae bacterium]
MKPVHQCEICGAPAVVHRSGTAGDVGTVHRYCMACADAPTHAVAGTQRGVRALLGRGEVGAALFALGAVSLCISVLADVLQFGQTQGFGWQQRVALIVAGVLALLGALFRTLVLVVIGLAAGGLTLVADMIGFGGHAGFGMQQALGTLVGVAMLAAGRSMMHGQPDHPPEPA